MRYINQPSAERRKRRPKGWKPPPLPDINLPNYCASCNTRVGEMEEHWRTTCKGALRAMCPRCPSWKPWSFSERELRRVVWMHHKACPGKRPITIQWKKESDE